VEGKLGEKKANKRRRRFPNDDEERRTINFTGKCAGGIDIRGRGGKEPERPQESGNAAATST